MGIHRYALIDEYVWCHTGMDEMQTYINHGWEEFCFVDIDLSDVTGKNRDYGIYRTHGLFRKPGSLDMPVVAVSQPLVDLDKTMEQL